MKFKSSSQIPFHFVIASNCPKCGKYRKYTLVESLSNRAICPDCSLLIDLGLLKEAEEFWSANLVEGRCIDCNDILEITDLDREIGFYQCKKCDSQNSIWEVKDPKFIEKPIELIDQIQTEIERNNLLKAYSLIDLTHQKQREKLETVLNRFDSSNKLYRSIAWTSAFAIRGIPISEYLITPFFELSTRITLGADLNETLEDFINLVYKKVLIISNLGLKLNDHQFTNLLQEVYLFLILTETSDREIFLNQLKYYISSKNEVRYAEEYLSSIQFIFDTSPNKFEESNVYFWESLSSVIMQFFPYSQFVKNANAYYSDKDSKEETIGRYQDDTDILGKYEEILGIKWSGNNFTEIKTQYRKLVSIYHPDKSEGDVEKFLQIQEAYLFFKQKGG